jgi:hypothetical protein
MAWIAKLSPYHALKEKHVQKTPFLHEIDPGNKPDWQSGPDSGPVIILQATVRGSRESIRTIRPCTNMIPAPFDHGLMPVNVSRVSL